MQSYFTNTNLEKGSYCFYLILEAVELRELMPHPGTPPG